MELLQLLSQDDLLVMQERFGDDGLSLEDFVQCFMSLLRSKVAENMATEEVLLRWSPSSLTNLFKEVDFNGDGSVSWEEFTSFAISVALASANSSSTTHRDDSFREYLQEPFALDGQSAQLRSLVYIPGVEKLVAEGFTRITVHDVSRPTCLAHLAVGGGELLDATYIPHMSLLVTSTTANHVTFFDALDKYEQRKQLVAESAVTKWIHPHAAPLFGPMRLVGGDRDGAISVLSLEKLRLNAAVVGSRLKNVTAARWPLHSDSVSSLHLVQHSSYSSIFSSSMDNTLLLSDPETGALRMSLVSGHNQYIRHTSVSSLHRLYVACGGETYATAASLDHRQQTPFILQDVKLPHVHTLIGVHADPNSHQIITADCGGTLKLWDARQFKCMNTFQIPRGNIGTVFGPAAKAVNTGGARTLGNMGVLSSIVYIQPKKALVTLGRETIKYVSDRRQTAITAHQHPLVALLYTSQTHSVITVTPSDLRVWSVLSGVCVAHFMELPLQKGDEVTCASADPMSGRRVFLGTVRGNVMCLLPTTGKQVWCHSVVALQDPLGDAIVAELNHCRISSPSVSLLHKQHRMKKGSSGGVGVDADPVHFGAKYRNNTIVFVYMVDRRSFVIATAAGEVFLCLEDDLFSQVRVYPQPVTAAGGVSSLRDVPPGEEAQFRLRERKQYDASLSSIGFHAFSLIAGLLAFTVEVGNKILVMETRSRSIVHINNDNYGPQSEVSALSFVHEAASGKALSVLAVGDEFGAVHLWTIRSRNIFGAATQHIATLHTPRHIGVASLCTVQERYLIAGGTSPFIIVWDLRELLEVLRLYVSPDAPGRNVRTASSTDVGSLGSRLLHAAQRHNALNAGERRLSEMLPSASKREAQLGSMAGESLEEVSLKKIEEALETCVVKRVFFESRQLDFVGYLCPVGSTGLFLAATVENDALVRVFSADGHNCGLLSQGRDKEAEVSSTREAVAEENSLHFYCVRRVLQTRKRETYRFPSPRVERSSDSGEASVPTSPTMVSGVPEELLSRLPMIEVDLGRVPVPETGSQERSRRRRKKRRHQLKHGEKTHIRVEALDAATTPSIVQRLIDIQAHQKCHARDGPPLSPDNPTVGGSRHPKTSQGIDSSIQYTHEVSSRRRWHSSNQMPTDNSPASSPRDCGGWRVQPKHHTSLCHGAYRDTERTPASLPLLVPSQQTPSGPVLSSGKRFVPAEALLAAHGSQQRQDEGAGEVSLRGAQLSVKEEERCRAAVASKSRRQRRQLEASPAAQRSFYQKQPLKHEDSRSPSERRSFLTVAPPKCRENASGVQTARRPTDNDLAGALGMFAGALAVSRAPQTSRRYVTHRID